MLRPSSPTGARDERRGQSQPNAGLPPGVSFEDAERIAQGDQNTIAALAARFGANQILPLQSEFIDFFAELPDIAWLALRQTMVAARIPIRDIDKKVAAQRAKLARAAAKESCAAKHASASLWRSKPRARPLRLCARRCLSTRIRKLASWARDSDEATLRRLYDNASPEKPLQVSDFVAHMPTQKYIYTPTGDLWPTASVDERVPPARWWTVRAIRFSTQRCADAESASEWLSAHAPVEQMTFAPGEPQIIKAS